MKLAEALSIRKDLQARIAQLVTRIENNVKVQEGDKVAEEPNELMEELEDCLTQLQELIFRINRTNMHTDLQGRTLTEAMAEKEVLTMRIKALRSIYTTASSTTNRYSRTEIKDVTVIDTKTLHEKIDRYSATLRKLDISIQEKNFTTELM